MPDMCVGVPIFPRRIDSRAHLAYDPLVVLDSPVMTRCQYTVGDLLPTDAAFVRLGVHYCIKERERTVALRIAGMDSRGRTPLALPLAAAWLLIVNLMQGGLQGPMTLACAAGLILAILGRASTTTSTPPGLEPTNPHHGRLPLALVLFLLYALVGLSLNRNGDGLQNIAVYIAFFATIALTASQTSKSTPKLWLPRLARLATVTGLIYGTTAVIFGFDTNFLYGARAFATVGLAGLCAAVPLANIDRKQMPRVAILVAAIGLSLSRTALASAWLILLFLAFRRPSRGGVLRALLGIAALGAGAWWALDHIPALKERFESNDNVHYFGVNIGTTGRAEIWKVLLASWQRGSHVFGRGPGSAEFVVNQVFGSKIGHPHSEYIRLLHDYGWFGEGILLVGMAQLGWRCYVAWRRATDRYDRAVHQAAILAWASLATMCITSNISVFVFAMIPLGALFGMSLGRMQPGDESKPGPMAADAVARSPAAHPSSHIRAAELRR
jgi:O-antigen ligase